MENVVPDSVKPNSPFKRMVLIVLDSELCSIFTASLKTASYKNKTTTSSFRMTNEKFEMRYGKSS